MGVSYALLIRSDSLGCCQGLEIRFYWNLAATRLRALESSGIGVGIGIGIGIEIDIDVDIDIDIGHGEFGV